MPDYADRCLKALTPYEGALLPALSEQLRKMTGVEIKADDWRQEDLPLYLKMNFKLVDEQGELLAENRDLNQLKQQ